MGDQIVSVIKGSAPASKPDPHDNPGVVAPPPVIQFGSILLGVTAHRLWPEPIPFAGEVAWVVIPFFMGLSCAIIALSFRQFAKHKTSVRPDRPASSLIREGPFRYSRNPLYVAVASLHVGIAFWVDSLWILLMLIPALLIMSRGVIAREERYLERKFGQEYLDYKASVRRWL